MSRVRVLKTTTVLFASLYATGAFADITAQEVWASWTSYFADLGYSVDARQQVTGSGLSVADVILNYPLPEDAGSLVMDMGTVNLTNRDDGTVSVDFQDNWRISFRVTDDSSAAMNGTAIYEQTNSSLIVSGAPADLTYTFSSDAVALRLEDLTVEGDTLPTDLFDFTVTMTGMAGSAKVKGTDVLSFDQDFSVSETVYDVRFTDPASNESFAGQGTLNGLSFKGVGDFPSGVASEDIIALLDAGFGFSGTYDVAGGTSTFTVNGPDGGGTINTESDGGALSVAMSSTGLTYRVEQNNLNANALFTQFPLPVSLQAGKSLFDLTMPVLKSDDSQDFGMALALQDFSIADSIWGLFDPAAQLPRDPATLKIDLSGQGKLLFDYLDPAQAAVIDQSGAAPGELEALSLNELVLDMVGARLTGAGAFTFDNGDTSTFGGFPRPKGAVDFQLVGGNVLLDTLVNMGFVPPEQANSVRLMMGLFTRPGDDADTLLSTIEVNDDGHVLANGQRIQ